MKEKIVFIDYSKISNSVVKIIARNIVMLSGESTSDIKVIHFKDLEKFKFTDESLVLVDPLISLDHYLLKKYIPKHIKVMNFNLGAYTTMNHEGILEQIECPNKENNSYLKLSSIFERSNNNKYFSD